MEREMTVMIEKMHPITYLDVIGENIADIAGTSADLFDSICH